MGAGVPQKLRFAYAWTAAALIEPTPFGEAVEAALLAGAAAQAACDPIRCQFDHMYGYLLQPQVPAAFPEANRKTAGSLFKGKVPDQVFETLNAAGQMQAEVFSYEQCILNTLFRAFTAKRVGDEAAQKQQEEHKEKLISEFEEKREHANEIWKKLIHQIEEHSCDYISLTAEQINATRQRIWDSGFPKLELLIMKAYGLSDHDIHWLKLVQLVDDSSTTSVTLVDMIRAMIEINKATDICFCECEEW